MNLNEGISLARRCSCGLCHPQWLRNGWVCHGPLPSPSQPRSRPQWAAAARRRQRDERRRLVPPSCQPQENRTHALFVTGMDGDLTLPQQAPTLNHLNLYRPEEDPWNAPRPPVEFVPFSALPLRLGRPPYDDDESDSDDPDLLRALEESLRTAEAEEQSRAAADRERQDRLSGQCVVCLEEKHGGAACCTGSTSTTDTVTESTTHFICHECIPMYLGSELQNDDSSDRRLMERRAFGHCLRCPCSPMPLNCGGYLEERHVRPFLTTALWSQLQAASEADEKHLQWQKESRDNEDPEFLREALLRSMPNAVQCGRCQYGPIDHTPGHTAMVHRKAAAAGPLGLEALEAEGAGRMGTRSFPLPSLSGCPSTKSPLPNPKSSHGTIRGVHCGVTGSGAGESQWHTSSTCPPLASRHCEFAGHSSWLLRALS